MRTCVTQNEKPVTNVDHVDQPFIDDRIAPHDDLALEIRVGGIRIKELAHGSCRPCAECWVLSGDHRDGRWPKEASLGGIGRIRNVDGLHATGVPVNKRQISNHSGIMRGEAPELLRDSGVGGAAAERELVLIDQILAGDERMCWIRRIDQPHPPPAAANAENVRVP